MTDTPCLRSGGLLAALFAGPLFLLTTIAFGPTRDGVRWAEVSALILLSAPFGAVVAILPVICGGATMRWLASHNEAMRLPVLWALIGAGAAAGWSIGYPETDDVTITALAVTGAASALICRAFVRWP